MNVRVFHVEFTASHRRDVHEHLLPVLRKLFPVAEIQVFIIDNSGQCSPDPDFEVVPGDNSLREFSAWTQTLDSTDLLDDDVVVLSNDTFARNYGTRYLSWFDQREVEHALFEGRIVGYVDSSAREFKVFNRPVRSWIRTNLFIAKWQTIRCLMPFVENFDGLFEQQGKRLFSDDSRIDDSLKTHLEHWLIKGPRLPGEADGVWYQAAELTDSNRQFMMSKAISILSELALSSKLQPDLVFDIRKSRRRALGVYALLERFRILSWLKEKRRAFINR